MNKNLQKESKNKLGFFWLIVLVFILFICIRFIHLPQSMGFGSDEGRDFLTTWRMIENRDFAVLGPPSQYSLNGRGFFFGPAPYYTILPALLAGNWSPLFVSYYLIVLNAVILLISLYLLRRQVKDKWVLSLFAFFCIFTPIVIDYTRSYWNPYFMFPISLLLLPLLVMSKHIQTQKKYFFGLIGFLFGLGLQFHYSFIFAIVIGVIWLLINRKLSIVSLVTLMAGFILGFLPIIVFELRNNFYNLSTLFLVFTSSAASQNQFSFNGYYYLISLFPFFFLFVSLILVKLKKSILLLLLGIYVIWSLFTVLQIKKYVLDYPTLQSLSASIESDNPRDFNVVDQLTRDNQAMALRYMLTVHGFTPHKEGDYQSAHVIYIYSQEQLEDLLKNPIYEIKSFLPFKTVATWKIENEIFIYRLEK
jgi:hypothetical protein